MSAVISMLMADIEESNKDNPGESKQTKAKREAAEKHKAALATVLAYLKQELAQNMLEESEDEEDVDVKFYKAQSEKFKDLA